MQLIYKFQKSLFRFMGDIKVFGWKHPLWFHINAHGYKLKGQHYYTIRELIHPGDILIRRYDSYLSSYALPGFWTHCGIYIGNDNDNPEQVIHSISEGVVQETLVEFMRTDHMLVLRFDNGHSAGHKERKIQRAIQEAKSIVGKPYDFGFDFENSDRFSCTELVAYCYPYLVEGKKRFGKIRIVADDFVQATDLAIVWDSRNEQQSAVIASFHSKNNIK